MSLHGFTSNARQYFSKRRVNRESHSVLLGRLIFMYHLEHQMVQIPSWLHSTFKDLSNEYSHAQIRVKMKELWPRQVGDEKRVAVRKYVATRWKYVATGSMSRLVSRPSKLSRPVSRQAVCRDQCRDQASCHDQCRDKQYVATSVATRMLCRDQKALSRPETPRNLKKSQKMIF